MEIKWTIQGKRGEAQMPIREFNTKREAVKAMEASRAPKTQINRDGRAYKFTERDK